MVAISYALWQRRYGANPSVLGRVLTMRGQAATIVAVMPRGFGFPARTEVWATARPFRPVAETAPPDFYVSLVGRLAPGATVDQSAAELTNYLQSNVAVLPMLLRGMTASAETFDDDLLGDVRPVILAVALLVAFAISRVYGQRRVEPSTGQVGVTGTGSSGTTSREPGPPAPVRTEPGPVRRSRLRHRLLPPKRIGVHETGATSSEHVAAAASASLHTDGCGWYRSTLTGLHPCAPGPTAMNGSAED